MPPGERQRRTARPAAVPASEVAEEPAAEPVQMNSRRYRVLISHDHLTLGDEVELEPTARVLTLAYAGYLAEV